MASLLIRVSPRTDIAECENCEKRLYSEYWESDDSYDKPYIFPGFDQYRSKQCPNCKVMWEKKIVKNVDMSGSLISETITYYRPWLFRKGNYIFIFWSIIFITLILVLILASIKRS